jgi:hypothetical protein
MVRYLLMEKPVQIFKSFAEAKAAEKEYHRSLTPAQRIEILLMLRQQPGPDGTKPTEEFVRVCRILKLSES